MTLWKRFLASGVSVECLLAQPEVAQILSQLNEDETNKLRGHLKGLREQVEAFSRHASRNAKACGYARRWEALYEVFLKCPNIELLERLQAHSKHAGIMHESMRRGTWHESMIDRLLQDSKNLRFLGSNLQEEVQAGDPHKEFVREFEKAFKVKVERHDSVSTGVYLYLDATNTEKLNTHLTSAQDFLAKIADKLGYICIRRGQPSDISYGSSSERLSKWVFVHCPATPEKDLKKLGGVKIISRGDLSSVKAKDLE